MSVKFDCPRAVDLALGPLAQSVEQRTFNPWVVGSSPTGPTRHGSQKNLKELSDADSRNYQRCNQKTS